VLSPESGKLPSLEKKCLRLENKKGIAKKRENEEMAAVMGGRRAAVGKGGAEGGGEGLQGF